MDEVKDTNPVLTDSTAPEQTTTPEPVPTPTDEAAPQGGTILTPPAEPVPTPEKAPEAYDFTGSLPEGYSLDETTAQGFGNVCREMNLTNEQANTMAKFGFDFIGQIQAAQEAQALQQSKDWATQTRTELGANFEKTVSLAGAGIERLEREIPELRSILNENGLGNRLPIVKLFARIGEMVSEDQGGTLSNRSNMEATGYQALYPNTDFKRYE